MGSKGDRFPKQPHLYTLPPPPFGPTRGASFLSPAPLAGPVSPGAGCAQAHLAQLSSTRSSHPLGPTLPIFLTAFSRWKNMDSHACPASPHRATSWSRKASPKTSELAPSSLLAPVFNHLRSTCAPGNSPSGEVCHTQPHRSLPGFPSLPEAMGLRKEPGLWIIVNLTWSPGPPHGNWMTMGRPLTSESQVSPSANEAADKSHSPSPWKD